MAVHAGDMKASMRMDEILVAGLDLDVCIVLGQK